MPARSRRFLRPALCRMTGISLTETLMSIVVVSFGLLGLAALQGRATNAELESYQRGQALILLHDMVNRIENNPANAHSYLTGDTPVGDGMEIANCTALQDRAAIDLCEWSILLQGASERQGGPAIGTMTGARGCIEKTSTERRYRIAVVWQGVGNATAPTNTDCGEGLYESEESRRAVTSTVLIPDLAGL